MNALGIDLGGTNVKGVLITDGGEILAQETNPIQHSDWKKTVAELVQRISLKVSDQKIKVGLAAPGLPDETNRQINFMPGRLDGLEQFDWSDFLKHDVHVLNDAHAALLAEVEFGVAKGKKNVVMLTLGTGVGGAILINGQLYQGINQRAGSIGDMSLDAESSEIGPLQIPGTLENAIGNESVPKRSGNRFQTTSDLVKAHLAGDQFASDAWLLSIKKLSVAISSLINILAPEMIVIGGGIAQANEALFKPLANYMNHYEWRPDGKPTPIVKAHFNEYAGAIGAACFGLQKRTPSDQIPKS
jgi:glucokinase